MIAGHGEGLLSGGNGALAEATAGGTDPAVEAADMDPMEPPPPQALKADSIAIRVKDLRTGSSLNACGRS
jgi:hypothetical protein